MELVVMSLGGSVIVPGRVDTGFLKGFRKLILAQQRKFIIICGGGRTARQYMEAASKIVQLTNDDLDWLGIHATRLNAHLLRTVLRDTAHPRVVRRPSEKVDFSEKVLIAAGWRPGWSTDHVAVLLAIRYGAGKLINVSSAEQVYDKDPGRFRDARPLSRISWPEFRAVVGEKWSPGLSTPFDPVASRKAHRHGLEVVIAGKSIPNLEKLLSGEKFKGTIIK